MCVLTHDLLKNIPCFFEDGCIIKNMVSYTKNVTLFKFNITCNVKKIISRLNGAEQIEDLVRLLSPYLLRNAAQLLSVNSAKKFPILASVKFGWSIKVTVVFSFHKSKWYRLNVWFNR